MIDPVLSDRFTAKELNKYFGVKFYSLLDNVTLQWYMWCRDPIQMAHYGQNLRFVTVREMVQNVFKAYSDTKAHLHQTGTYSSLKDRTMRLRMLQAFVCLVPKAVVKYYAKKFMMPLRLWDVLKFVKNVVNPSRLP